jgi:hypothetical protein
LIELFKETRMITALYTTALWLDLQGENEEWEEDEEEEEDWEEEEWDEDQEWEEE